MDSNGDGVLQFHEFVRACRGMHFGGNLRKVFEDLTQGEESLRPESLDPALPAELLKGADSYTSRRALEDSSPERSGPQMNHGRRCSAETAGEVHLLLQRPEAAAGPPADAKAFKNALVKKFGKLSYA